MLRPPSYMAAGGRSLVGVILSPRHTRVKGSGGGDISSKGPRLPLHPVKLERKDAPRSHLACIRAQMRDHDTCQAMRQCKAGADRCGGGGPAECDGGQRAPPQLASRTQALDPGGSPLVPKELCRVYIAEPYNSSFRSLD